MNHCSGDANDFVESPDAQKNFNLSSHYGDKKNLELQLTVNKENIPINQSRISKSTLIRSH